MHNIKFPPGSLGLRRWLSWSMFAATAAATALNAAPGAANTTPAPYASDLTPGHSWHGEAFNTGPRQKAYLMQGMPRINFPVTTASAEAQRFFNQGVGQLHGFWYLEAERSFRQVLQLDPNCAMAYWGMAMANVRNDQRARQFVTNAIPLKAKLSRREQLYLDAWNDFYLEEKDGKTRDRKQRRRELIRNYENLVQEFPNDLEAKAFLIYQVWDNSGFGNETDLPISSHLPIDLLARQVLAADPLHPMHHFRIHLWDSEKPANALDSAAQCGQGSPGIAHMWHMPGHTYSKTARYDDASWQQEASARVDHAHMIRDHVLPDEIHNYSHNNDWLVGNFAFQGRLADALALAKNMIELPRLMRTNAAFASNPRTQPYDFSRSSWSLGRRRLLEHLVQFEQWDELIRLASTPWLDAQRLHLEQASLDRALGLAYFHKNQHQPLGSQITALDKTLDAVRFERQGAADFAETRARAEKKSPDDIAKAMTEALKPYNSQVERIESFKAELRAYAAWLKNDSEGFKSHMELAKDIPKERQARLYWQTGNQTKALELALEAANSATNQIQPLASLADLRNRAGKSKEAQQSFEQLRAIRAKPDLNLPVIQRLQPIARSLGLPADWRFNPLARPDSGKRPSLDSLGPLHWQPFQAGDWSLIDAQGKTRSLKDYRGKPVVLLFFLGRGCSHCMDQLNAFAPLTAKFAEAGIALAAISTDSADGLRRTTSRGDGAKPFPFPLLSDSSLSAFKNYRAHDDFENVPLHGVFFVDASGRVRWQDIGYEPFQEPAFLLAEAKRLLAFSGSGASGGKEFRSPTPLSKANRKPEANSRKPKRVAGIANGQQQ